MYRATVLSRGGVAKICGMSVVILVYVGWSEEGTSLGPTGGSGVV